MTHSLRLKCYNCGAIMRSVERQAGKRSRCAACKSPLRIPSAAVFAQYDGQKVQAIKEPEWDFKYLKDQKPKDPARSGFIGEDETLEDDDNIIIGRPGSEIRDDGSSAADAIAAGAAVFEDDDDDSGIGESEPASLVDSAMDAGDLFDDSEIGESEPASMIDSAAGGGDLASVFESAGEAAAEDLHDTATDQPWQDFDQTIDDSAGPIAQSNIATPSLMDLTDDASVAAAAAAESAIGPVGGDTDPGMGALIESDDDVFDPGAPMESPVESTVTAEESEDAFELGAPVNANDLDEIAGVQPDPTVGNPESNIATPSLMDLTDDASVAAAAAAESAVSEHAPTEVDRNFMESDVFDEDMTLPADDDSVATINERPMADVEDDFRTAEFTRTVDDSGEPIAMAGTGTEVEDEVDFFEPLEDDMSEDRAPAVGELPELEGKPEGSLVEFGDSDMDFEVPGAVHGDEADLKALLDDFDDEVDG